MSHFPRGHHSQPPRTFGAVLWFPLARYARNPFLLFATTALPLIPGQLLGAYLLLRRTEDARVVELVP